MDMKVNRSELQDVLSKIESVVPSKPSIMVLNGVLFYPEGDNMGLMATDLENTIKTSFKAEGVTGSCVLNGKKIISLVKQLTKDEVEIKGEEQVEVKSGSSKYKFLSMDTQEYPVFPERKKTEGIKIDSEKLKDCLKSVLFCVDADEPRPHFRGVLMDVQEKKIILVATDTKRLATAEMEIESGTPNKILLPVKAAYLLMKSLKGEVIVYEEERTAFFEGENISIACQLLSGVEDFPDYNKVIPKEEVKAEIEVEQFKTALNRVSLFTSERYQKILFNFSKNKLGLVVTSPDSGEAKEEIEIKYEGEDKTLAFTPSMSEYLTTINDKAIGMYSSTEKSPCKFVSEGVTGCFVAMPLRIE